MKRILAIVMVLVMALSLVACKSKEQKAADKWLKDYEAFLEEAEEIAEDGDLSKLEDLMEEAETLGEEGEEIYEDLKDKDKDAAKEFLEEMEEMTMEFMEVVM